MSSSRALIALVLAAGLSASACAVRNPIVAETPTQQFSAKVDAQPQGILLRPGGDILSKDQHDAVWSLVQDWREVGAGMIVVEGPRGDPGARHTAALVQTALQSFGVRAGQFLVDDYDAAPGAPVRVSFLRYSTEPLKCGTGISDYTATFDNKVNSNFGCAVTANIAAMVANPTDLAGPRAETPFDAGRRQMVLDKYRAGEATASVKEKQADGAVSRALN